MIIDVAGYYQAGAGDGFTSQAPVRILDSRPGGGNIGGFTTPWAGGTTRKVAVVGGVSGVPADADAVVLNVTVTGTTGSSFLTLWPSDQSQPTASNLNWTPGVTIPNAVTVKVGAGGLNAGMVSVFNLFGNTDVIIDVAGYYKSGTGLAFHPVAPARVLDSRPGAGNVGAFTTPWGPGIVRGVPGRRVRRLQRAPHRRLGGGQHDGDQHHRLVVPHRVARGGGAAHRVEPQLDARTHHPQRGDGEVGHRRANAGRLSMFNLAGNVDVITDVAGWFG